MNERLKIVRKHYNKIQKDFGSELGVSRDTYASYESGRVVPSDTFVQLLCTKFNVNEEWLRNGTGEMFVESEESILDELIATHNLTQREVSLVRAFLQLSPEGRDAVIKFAEKIVNGSKPSERINNIAQRIEDTNKKIPNNVPMNNS